MAVARGRDGGHRSVRIEQSLEHGATRGDLGDGARVDDASLVEHDDAVGDLQARPAMRHQQRGPQPGGLAQPRVDPRLDERIDGRCRVVEHEQPRRAEQGAGDRNPLPLAAGEGEPALAHDRIETIGQRVDELLGFGRPGGRPDVLIGGIGPSIGDVGRDGVGEQEALVEDDGLGRTHRGEAGLPHVDAAQPDRSFLGIEVPLQQRDECRLAGSGTADQCDRLTGCDGQRQPVQDRDRPVVVTEADLVELDSDGSVRNGYGIRRVVDGGPRVDDLQNPLDACSRLLPNGQQGGELANGGDQRAEIGGEGKERAQRQVSLEGQPAAEQ